MESKTRRFWVRLCGLNLFLSLYRFYLAKIFFVERYYTIAAGRKFRGKVLKKPYVLHPGWIIGWRWEGDGSKRRRVYYHVRSIYDLERMLGHAIAGEEVAREDVAVSIEEAIAIIRDLQAYWPLTDDQRAQLNQMLGELYERFEHARNESLKKGTEQVMAAAGFADRRGVPNPGASAARLAATRSRYTVRLGEILAIVPNLSRLQVVVVQEMHRIQGALCERALEKIMAVRRVLRGRPGERDLRWVVAILEQAQHDLGTIKVAPFWRNCRYTEAEIVKVIEILQDARLTPDERAASVLPTLNTMVYSIAWKRAQRVLEELIKDLSIALREGTLSETKGAAFIRKVEAFKGKALLLKEEGFKRKRLPTVLRHLDTALARLKASRPKEAKESLKSASRIM